MEKDVLLALATMMSSIIGTIIAGYFSIAVARVQRSSRNETVIKTKILLPDGVQIKRQQKWTQKINLWLLVIPLVSTMVGFFMGLNIKASQPALPERSSGTVVSLTYVLLAFGVVGIAAFIYFIIKQKQLGRKAYSVIGVSTVSLLMLAIASYYVIALFLEQRTVYILVDVSSDYNGLYSGVVSELNIAANEIPGNVDIGLGIFGGNPSGSVDCGNVKELVAPSSKVLALAKLVSIRESLLQIQPQGTAGLENAVELTLSRLSGRKGVHEIVIITPRIDTICGIPSKDFINEIAKTTGVDAEIFIVSVGDIPEDEQEKLKNLSDKYEHVGTPGELVAIMKDIFAVPPALYPSSK